MVSISNVKDVSAIKGVGIYLYFIPFLVETIKIETNVLNGGLTKSKLSKFL